jgi:hypothetical protein
MISKKAIQAVVTLSLLVGVSLLFTYFIPFFLSWHKKFEFIHVVEVEALLLSIFALLFAVKQFRDSAEVSKQLSTRFLSIFPGNLQEITAFVSQSSDNLDIMADYAGYGAYSDPYEFSRYCSALENRARASSVRILLYANNLARKAIAQQWPKEAFQKEKEAPLRLERFLDQHQQLILPSSSREIIERIDYDLFIELQLKAQIEIQRRLANRKTIEIRFIDDNELVILAWIRPDHHAIFSFKNRGIKAKEKLLRELVFQSRDTSLVGVLHDLFDQLWTAADPAVKQEGQTMVKEVGASSASQD